MKFSYGLTQNGFQPAVQLHSAYLFRAQTELLGQRANPGPDLQYASGIIHARFPGDGFRNPGRNQKILPLCL